MSRKNKPKTSLPSKRGRPVHSILDRFWSYVDIRGDDECWEWNGTKDKDGYGRLLTLRGKTPIRVNRFSWEYYNRQEIPIGMIVCHRCDNSSCVNPKHLFLGTNKDNTQDMIQKGRKGYNNIPGEKHPKAKLTNEKILEIRKLWNTGQYTKRALGRLFSIGDRQIGYIVRRETWSHI